MNSAGLARYLLCSPLPHACSLLPVAYLYAGLRRCNGPCSWQGWVRGGAAKPGPPTADDLAGVVTAPGNRSVLAARAGELSLVFVAIVIFLLLGLAVDYNVSVNFLS